MSLQGGYNLGVTAEGVGQCLRVLLGAPPTLPPPGPPQPAALAALGRTLHAQRPAWDCLRLPHGEPPPPPRPPKSPWDPLRPPWDLLRAPGTP